MNAEIYGGHKDGLEVQVPSPAPQTIQNEGKSYHRDGNTHSGHVRYVREGWNRPKKEAK